MTPDKIIQRVLIAVFLLLAARVAWNVAAFRERSVQMDFAAFYAAGQSVAAGLTPYANHVERQPPIWDGVNRYAHSRFLYPPLVARGFRLLTVVPYHTAKLLWMLASLAALAASTWVAWRRAADRLPSVYMAALGILVVAFFPTLALLERGQVDAFTLLLLVAMIALIGRGGRRERVAGALLAIATLLKLHCVFVLPFLLLRKRWQVLAGFAAGSVTILLAGLLADGAGAWQDFALHQLPRISRYGEGGTRAMLLPPAAFQRAMRGVPPGLTAMDGRAYEPEALQFVLNASMVRTPLGRAIWNGLKSAGVSVAPGFVSLALLAVFLALLAGWQLRSGLPAGGLSGLAELAYWQSVMVVVLLCAPATWAMNTVWLLPIGVVALLAWRVAPGPRGVASSVLCGLGLLIAGTPDGWARLVLAPAGEFWPNAKYIIAELLCLAGLLGMWRQGDDSS